MTRPRAASPDGNNFPPEFVGSLASPITLVEQCHFGSKTAPTCAPSVWRWNGYPSVLAVHNASQGGVNRPLARTAWSCGKRPPRWYAHSTPSSGTHFLRVTHFSRVTFVRCAPLLGVVGSGHRDGTHIQLQAVAHTFPGAHPRLLCETQAAQCCRIPRNATRIPSARSSRLEGSGTGT